MNKSLKFDPMNLESSNKAFHKLSKKNKCLLIAKDVLKQLKSTRYVPTTGVYHESLALKEFFGFGYNTPDQIAKNRKNSTLLQETLLSKDPICEVCALGAAFFSLSRTGNQVTIGDKVHLALMPIFGKVQVGLIEFAFEGYNHGYYSDCHVNDLQAKAAISFYKKYRNTDKRLAAIFRNIIKNEGIFKP